MLTHEIMATDFSLNLSHDQTIAIWAMMRTGCVINVLYTIVVYKLPFQKRSWKKWLSVT